MRNPERPSTCSFAARSAGKALLLALPSCVLLLGTGVASAGTRVTAEDSSVATFGLLGPVGLAAVAIGIVGMMAGVLRQRRRERPTTALPVERPAEPATPEDSTRPELSPVPHRRSA